MKKTIENDANQLELDFSLENGFPTFIEEKSMPVNPLNGINSALEVKVFKLSEKLQEAEKLSEREIIDYIISNSKRF